MKLKPDIKIAKLQLFDGTPSKFKDWYFKFEHYAKITGSDGNQVEMA